MKLKLFFFLSFCLCLLGCSDSDSDSESIDLSQTEFANVSALGETLSVTVTSNSSWSYSSNQDWCTPEKESDNSTLSIVVSANTTGSERSAVVTVVGGKTKKTINITQSATSSTGGDSKYKIPVVFQVLYQNANNTKQNISQARINEILAACNALYDNSLNKSTDMDLQFVLATTNPSGVAMAEPGINRTKVNSWTIDCEDFMENESSIKYMWDQDKYINIVFYNFTNENILGISHLPYTVSPDALDGLYQIDKWPTASSLGYAHCVSINSSYADEEQSIEGELYNPSDIVATIAHELGHYLGLLHAFNEDEEGNLSEDNTIDSDYCDDTPPYNRVAYETYVGSYQPILGGEDLTFDDLPYLMQRTNCKTGVVSTPNNIMDYEYSYVNLFTPDQKSRVSYVLTHSPLIPAEKATRSIKPTTGRMDLPMRMMK